MTDSENLSLFTPLFRKRLLFGVASTILCNLPLFPLRNSPITSALETELLRWRFEFMHAINNEARSGDVVIVYLKPTPGKSRAQAFESLLNRIEGACPAVVGIDLSAGEIDSGYFKNVTGHFSNIVVCAESDPTLANSLFISDNGAPDAKRALRNAPHGLYVEANGMPSLIPNSKTIFSNGQEGGFAETIASRYRPSIGSSMFKSLGESSHFINYEKIKFDTMDSASLNVQPFKAGSFKDKIVLIGSPRPGYVIPSDFPHLHSALGASEPLVQAFAIQNMIDGTTIVLSSRRLFGNMIYALALIEFVMPIVGHWLRLAIFATSFLAVVVGSYVTLSSQHVLIQVWPFVLGLLSSFLYGTVIYSVTDLQERNSKLKQAQSSLEKRNIELEEARKGLETRGKEVAKARELGMEEERKRIALDLHDDALKELFLASSTIEKSIEKGLKPDIGRQVQTKLHEASDKIRRIMANLSPSTLSVCGLSGAIEALALTLREESEMEVSFQSEIGSELDSLDESKALLIYRIVQEACNNIQKHSGASQVLVKLAIRNENLIITVADNGTGFGEGSTSRIGYGLNNMKHRADLVGAQLTWSKPAEFATGTQINLMASIIGM